MFFLVCLIQILKQLGGKTVSWEQAQSMLDNRFSKAKKGSKPVVMLVDEVSIYTYIVTSQKMCINYTENCYNVYNNVYL